MVLSRRRHLPWSRSVAAHAAAKGTQRGGPGSCDSLLVRKRQKNWQAGYMSGTAVKSTGRLLRGCCRYAWRELELHYMKASAQLKWIPVFFFLHLFSNAPTTEWTETPRYQRSRECNWAFDGDDDLKKSYRRRQRFEAGHGRNLPICN